MSKDRDKAKQAAKLLASIGGSQPDFQAAPQRRPPLYLNKQFNTKTGEYDLEPGEG